MRGKPVTGAHPLLRMFSLCESMKWAHLPEPGGIYAQSPQLMDAFQFIFSERAEHEAEERRKEERQSNKNSARSAQRSRASRPRR